MVGFDERNYEFIPDEQSDFDILEFEADDVGEKEVLSHYLPSSDNISEDFSDSDEF